MRNTTLILVIFLSTLLIGCRHEKALVGVAQTDLKKMTESVSKNQQLTEKEVEISKQAKTVNTPSGQKEIIAASSYLKPVSVDSDSMLTDSTALQAEAGRDIVLLDEKPDSDRAKYLYTPLDLKQFSVVVGSFSTLEKAMILAHELVKAGYRPMIVPNGQGAFRVIASTYDDRDSADLDVLGLELDSIKSWILKK